jgi:3-oxoacyl-[acyl-carrier-protein] synthase-3
MTYSRIAGTGSYLPANVVTNHDLERMMDTSDEWIQERTGIKRRHLAADDESTSDLALAAANQALDMAGLTAEDIGLIIIATTTPDKVFPGTACIVQRRLGIGGCAAFDIQAACSGFVYGLDLADRHIRTGGAKNALVIGAETLSRLTNWEDRTTAVLFGDGAGAVVLQETDKPGIISTHIVHPDERQRGIPARRGNAGLDRQGDARQEQHRQTRSRLVRTPPGEHENNFGGGEEAGYAYGTRHRDGG